LRWSIITSEINYQRTLTFTNFHDKLENSQCKSPLSRFALRVLPLLGQKGNVFVSKQFNIQEDGINVKILTSA